MVSEVPVPPKKKILLADDDNFLLEIYANKFRAEGFEVVAAHDGQEAWEIIGQGNIPDVVFTGIIMPRMTGFDLVRKLQADPNLANVPVVIFSHRGRPEDQKAAEELGVDDFIVQGAVPIAEVVRHVNLVLGVRTTFVLKLSRDDPNVDALVRLLELQQGISCPPSSRIIIIELESEKEKGKFTARLMCE